jgi:hypothetical protein
VDDLSQDLWRLAKQRHDLLAQRLALWLKICWTSLCFFFFPFPSYRFILIVARTCWVISSCFRSEEELPRYFLAIVHSIGPSTCRGFRSRQHGLYELALMWKI